jgi:glycogen synthase
MTPSLLAKVGLNPERMARPETMLDDSRPGFAPGTHDCSLLRGAIAFSDRVTTVSPTYAREVFSPEYGMGAQVTGQGARRGVALPARVVGRAFSAT